MAVAVPVQSHSFNAKKRLVKSKWGRPVDKLRRGNGKAKLT